MRHKFSRLIGKIPLQVIFIVPFVVQIILVVGFTGYISFRNGQRTVNTLTAELQDEISQRIEERLNNYLTTPHILNKIEAHAIESGQIDLSDENALLPYFWQNLQLFEGLNATFFGTENGMMVGARRLTDTELEVMLASETTEQSLNYYIPDEQGFPSELVTGAANYDPRQRSWYTEALALGESHWSPIYLDFATGMLVITAGQPVYTEDGSPIGVVGSAFQFEQVNDFLQSLEIGENGQTFIMDRTGLLVSTSTTSPIARSDGDQLTRLTAAESENVVERETAVALKAIYGDLNNIQSVQNLTIEIDGQNHYIQATPVADDYGLDWLVVVAVPASDFMTEIQANNHTTIFFIILALIGASLTGILTTGWVTRPLVRIRDTALAFSMGDWDQRVTTTREGEFGLLANTFNQMAEQLQSSFTKVERSQARYESMFNYVPIMIVEEDFSAVKQYLDSLRQQGITDLEAYLNANPDAIVECARRVTIIAVNQAVIDIMDESIEKIMAPLDKHLSQEEYDIFRREIIALANGQTQFSSGSSLVTKDGRKLQTYFRLKIVPGYEESWSRVLVLVEDITERLQMENDLRQSEKRLKRAQCVTRIGDWEIDLETLSISWSEELYRLFERPIHLGPAQYEESLKRYLPEDREKIQRQTQIAIETGQQLEDTYQIQLPSGKIAYHTNTLYPISDENGHIIKISGTVQDITDQTLLKNQVQSQERLAAIGQFAAGIAHDFNNILSSITLYTDLIYRTSSNLSPKDKSRLEIISSQADQAAQLIQQILDFSRQSPLLRSPMNILDSLQELINLLNRTLPENIVLEFTYDQDSYIAGIDPARFQQIFMNLAVNARDAMPLGGRLTFDVTSYHLHIGHQPPVRNMPSGNWIRIQVSDTGDGIEEADLSHIFEPFFTTKVHGKGTGLGLAQVYGIISQHDGFITIESKKGEGTMFTVFFPVLSEIEKDTTNQSNSEIEKGNGETILLVEDDQLIREVLVSTLTTLNYQTLVAENGREALAIIEKSKETINLVLSDMRMPEMSGLELVETMRQQNCRLPVVILSGYLLEDDLEKMRDFEVVGWLNKPPNINQLAALLRQGLDHSLK